MKKCYVVGNPISHSLSPKVFNYLFEQNNINASYSKFNAKNENEFLEFIEKKDFYGLNVTLPYKKNAYDIVIGSNNSLTINSINCIKNNNGILEGYNTDQYGFLQMIKNLNLNLNDYNFLILGNGGAALTISHTLINYSNNDILIWGRNKKNVQKFINEFSNHRINFLKKNIDKPLIVINCISINIDKESINTILSNLSLNNIKLFMDLNYVDTELSLKLKNDKIDVVLGIDMFIYQALKTFEIWFGKHNSSYNDIKRLLDK